MQLLSLNGEDNLSKCPLCEEEISKDDLRNALIVDQPHIKVGEDIEFKLVQISTSSIVCK